MSEPLIVLDPGHGGTEAIGGSSPFGAQGPRNGTREKDVTLAIARSAQRALGSPAVLTRSEDRNVALADRVRVARDRGAVAFVSIHANSGARGVRGSETWIWSDHAGAGSQALAEHVQRSLSALGHNDRGVRSGRLAVLDPSKHGPGTAACLAEVDFLTDPSGEERLTHPAEVETIGRALADGILSALRTSPHTTAHGADELYGRRSTQAPPRTAPARDNEGDPLGINRENPDRHAVAMTAYAVPLSCTINATSAAWAADDLSPDHRHLGTLNAQGQGAFTLTAAHLQSLCRANRFDVGTDELVVFGLRGCRITGTNDGAFHDSVELEAVLPDHHESRCVIGVWKRTPASAQQVAVFTASTVPFRDYMRGHACEPSNADKLANMLLTGLYGYQVGSHKELNLALREHGRRVVVRTRDDLIYEVTDDFMVASPMDNIHPSFRRNDQTFSSAGCQTVRGGGTGDAHHDPADESPGFRTFWERLGSPGAGTAFKYVLLTGREACLRARGQSVEDLTRLRFGSTGADVATVQLELRRLGFYTGTVDSQMGPGTVDAYIRWQKATERVAGAVANRGDGVVTQRFGLALGLDLLRGLCVNPRPLEAA